MGIEDIKQWVAERAAAIVLQRAAAQYARGAWPELDVDGAVTQAINELREALTGIRKALDITEVKDDTTR